MRKFLPKTSNSGFTLVELLIVVSILAILAVIGVTVYGNVQRDARDAKRKADIDAIANAMEANYSNTGGQYAAMSPSFFSSGVIPSDPRDSVNGCGGTVLCRYCGGTSAMTMGANTSGACTGGSEGALVAADRPGAGTTFRVCATLETTTPPLYYCRQNQR